jgi:hypothetical protein
VTEDEDIAAEGAAEDMKVGRAAKEASEPEAKPTEGETAGGSEHPIEDGEWENNLENGELNRPAEDWGWPSMTVKKSKSKKMKRVK